MENRSRQKLLSTTQPEAKKTLQPKYFSLAHRQKTLSRASERATSTSQPAASRQSVISAYESVLVYEVIGRGSAEIRAPCDLLILIPWVR